MHSKRPNAYATLPTARQSTPKSFALDRALLHLFVFFIIARFMILNVNYIKEQKSIEVT